MCLHDYALSQEGIDSTALLSFHSLVWKLCPKVLHLGIRAVEIACALAISQWNDRLSSLRAISNRIGTPITTVSSAHLQQRDVYNLKKARYRASGSGKALRALGRGVRGVLSMHEGCFTLMYQVLVLWVGRLNPAIPPRGARW